MRRTLVSGFVAALVVGAFAAAEAAPRASSKPAVLCRTYDSDGYTDRFRVAPRKCSIFKRGPVALAVRVGLEGADDFDGGLGRPRLVVEKLRLLEQAVERARPSSAQAVRRIAVDRGVIVAHIYRVAGSGRSPWLSFIGFTVSSPPPNLTRASRLGSVDSSWN